MFGAVARSPSCSIGPETAKLHGGEPKTMLELPGTVSHCPMLHGRLDTVCPDDDKLQALMCF